MAITTKLPVTPIYNGAQITNYNQIETVINDAIDYCRNELKVEPGSDQALEFDY